MHRHQVIFQGHTASTRDRTWPKGCLMAQLGPEARYQQLLDGLALGTTADGRPRPGLPPSTPGLAFLCCLQFLHMAGGAQSHSLISIL